MKFVYAFLVLISLNNCKTNYDKEIVSTSKNELSNCPKDGSCKLEVLKNKSLYLAKDGIGMTYPDILFGNNIVLKYTYDRNKMPNIEDSGYIEEVFIELNPNSIEQNLENNQLVQVKTLFSRLCFCKGQTGYYKISEGILKITKNEDQSYHLDLEFNTNEVPQIITKISQDFTL